MSVHRCLSQVRLSKLVAGCRVLCSSIDENDIMSDRTIKEIMDLPIISLEHMFKIFNGEPGLLEGVSIIFFFTTHFWVQFQ